MSELNLTEDNWSPQTQHVVRWSYELHPLSRQLSVCNVGLIKVSDLWTKQYIDVEFAWGQYSKCTQNKLGLVSGCVALTGYCMVPKKTSCDPQGLRGRQNNADEGEREPSALPVCTQRQKEKSVLFDKKITQLNGKKNLLYKSTVESRWKLLKNIEPFLRFPRKLDEGSCRRMFQL